MKGHVYHCSTINHCCEPFVLKLSKLSTKEVLYDGGFKNNSFASHTHFHFYQVKVFLKS
jgi:cobyrinic acid a,c-diamide synthase